MTTPWPTAGRSPLPPSTRADSSSRSDAWMARFRVSADRRSEGSRHSAVAPRRRPARRKPRCSRGILRRGQQARPAAAHSRPGLSVDPERRQRAGRSRGEASGDDDRACVEAGPTSRLSRLNATGGSLCPQRRFARSLAWARPEEKSCQITPHCDPLAPLPRAEARPSWTRLVLQGVSPATGAGTIAHMEQLPRRFGL